MEGMNEKEEIIQNLRDNIIMLNDVVEELRTDVYLLRIMNGKPEIKNLMQNANQIHIEDIDNECLGDMQ